jgi:hypothetical protein
VVAKDATLSAAIAINATSLAIRDTESFMIALHGHMERASSYFHTHSLDAATVRLFK